MIFLKIALIWLAVGSLVLLLARSSNARRRAAGAGADPGVLVSDSGFYDGGAQAGHDCGVDIGASDAGSCGH